MKKKRPVRAVRRNNPTVAAGRFTYWAFCIDLWKAKKGTQEDRIEFHRRWGG